MVEARVEIDDVRTAVWQPDLSIRGHEQSTDHLGQLRRQRIKFGACHAHIAGRGIFWERVERIFPPRDIPHGKHANAMDSRGRETTITIGQDSAQKLGAFHIRTVSGKLLCLKRRGAPYSFSML